MEYHTVVFRRRFNMAKRPINATKNVVDASGALIALTETIIIKPINTVVGSAVNQNNFNEIARGSKVNGFYLSLFFASDTNAAAAEVPLLDWYCFYNRSGIVDETTFSSTNPAQLPAAGATGTNTNRNQILHEEKGLIGEKNDGSKMVFTGVIKLPKGFQTFREKTSVVIVAKSNQTGVFCAKAIYKWYE